MGNKVSFEKYKSAVDLVKAIDSVKFRESEIKDQLYVLNEIFAYSKKKIKEGTNIEVLKDALRNYMSNLLATVKEPTLNDFYRYRTVEYMYKNKKVFEKYVREFLENGEVKKERDNFKYSESIKSNVTILLKEVSMAIEALDGLCSKDFNEIKAKISSKELDENDFKLFHKYVVGTIKELYTFGKHDYLKRIKENPDILYRKMYRDRDRYFQVEEIKIKKTEPKLNVLNKKVDQKGQPLDVSNLGNYKYPKVSIKKFAQEPFLSSNEDRNADLCIFKVLNSIPDSEIDIFYQGLIASKNDDELREGIYEYIRTLDFTNRCVDVDLQLNQRLTVLSSFMDNTHDLRNLNEHNQMTMDKFKMSYLKMDSEELVESIQKRDSSLEAKVAMSAFYVNKLSKIVNQYSRPMFIFDKKNVLEKLKENPELTLKDFNYTKSEIIQYMKEYDGLQQIITSNFMQKNEKGENKKITSMQEFMSKITSYEEAYDKKYGDYKMDITNVCGSTINIDILYRIKDFSAKSLIYTALTQDDNKNIVNWGYVMGDKNKNKKMCLLGFDIKGMNLPLMIHMRREEVASLMYECTGDTKIPVYFGSNDLISGFDGKRTKTHVMYPLSAKQRKALLADTTYNMLMRHVKWMQKPKLLKELYKNEDTSQKFIELKRQAFTEPEYQNR